MSPSFTPASVGTYRWIAAYGGDANNTALSASCNDANENAVVSSPPVQDVPTLSRAMLVLLSLLLGAMACAGFGVRRR
ncbi:MAG TPA: IPTL-CTERM sorting domain-containing protein [Casimicrobiaceae bacterium]